MFIKFKYYQDAVLKNGPYHPLVCFRCEPIWSSFNNTRRELIQRIVIYFSLFWPNLYKNTPANRPNGLNEDDRLNLAEHPMFDESLCSANSYTYKPNNSSSDPFNENDEILISSNKNPYCSLTIKS
jgi:hypothetical protein